MQLGAVHRFTLLSALYVAQGLPFGFFTLALPVLLRDAGWSLTAIGMLQFLSLPWGIKFLWAPALDHHGTRRGWLLGFQLSAVVTALVLSQLALEPGGILLFVAVFAFNLIAASQDVVTDGLAVRVLSAKERGLANAIQVGAYRLGMILGGGLLLWLFAQTGWRIMFLAMAAMLAITVLPVLPLKEAPRNAEEEAAKRSRRPGGLQLAIAWLHRALAPGMAAFAGLIFCYRFGDQLLNSLIAPFLIDQGITKETIALMKGAVGSGTSLLGATVGGWVTYRLGPCGSTGCRSCCLSMQTILSVSKRLASYTTRSSGGPTDRFDFIVESIDTSAHLAASSSGVSGVSTRSSTGLPYLDSPIWKGVSARGLDEVAGGIDLEQAHVSPRIWPPKIRLTLKSTPACLSDSASRS
jgi:MFS family permease